MDPKKTPEPAAAPTPTDYDAMASAFDSLMEPSTPEGEPDPVASEGEQPAPSAEGAPAPVAEGAPAPAAEPDKEPATEGVAAPASVEGAAPVGEPDKEPATPTTEEVDWEARFKELEAKVNVPQPEAKQPQEPEKPPVDAPPVYSKDEQEFLTQYDKDWPDIVRGEALKRRHEYQQIVAHVFNEIQRVWGPLVQQGAQAAETVADTTTLAAIREAHSDYNDAMYDAVIEYANGLTGMAKRVALATIEDGEVGDVIDLIADYKRAKGLDKPKVVAGSGAPAPAATVTELPAAAKKAAKALGVVDSKRTATTTATDPNDFDSAWDEAVGSK